MHRPEREQALAKTALALMGECNVTPTPENFELFYAYATGENQAVAQVIGQMIAARKPFTAELLQDLRTPARNPAHGENRHKQILWNTV